MTSDVEMESEEEREEMKKKRRDRSRSKSPEKGDKRKHKKHKKDKKKHKKRETDDEDTGNEGGETPENHGAQDEEEGELNGKKEKRKEERKREKSPDDRDRRKYDRNREKEESGRDRRRRRSRSREREREKTDVRENYKREDKKETEKDAEPGEIDQGGGSQVLSLSVEETNKLRAKLGLKPLKVNTEEAEVDENSDQPGVLIPGDRNKTRHLAPDHWGQRDYQKKMREKLTVTKEKRKINTKLSVVKGLGDSDSDDDSASKWIERQKQKVKEKEEAEKRAKAMAELDEEFGVGDIVESNLKDKKQKEYSERNLKGIRVEHSSEAFGARDTVLTLK